ncbi:uncharacterized protein LOC110852888 isoform X2 [Folsomia candida]|uniref:uncharacterized protein LOC110852888 isoform X2 n=1 Tax=Folsomia candida TaxID=158441 RepID=UPI000B8FC15C|nr:uncharacterized protein LOC110852888 isoform X2 [Folsomia candida]XP_035710153.1 uncharacterized protein LOC110852888 isoform X2 [Folsomia candida]
MAITDGGVLPYEVKNKIISILKAEAPEGILVITLGQKYEEEYGSQLIPEEFGFKTLFEMVKSINSGVGVFFHETLHLWACKYEEPEPVLSGGSGSTVF